MASPYETERSRFLEAFRFPKQPCVAQIKSGKSHRFWKSFMCSARTLQSCHQIDLRLLDFFSWNINYFWRQDFRIEHGSALGTLHTKFDACSIQGIRGEKNFHSKSTAAMSIWCTVPRGIPITASRVLKLELKSFLIKSCTFQMFSFVKERGLYWSSWLIIC